MSYSRLQLLSFLCPRLRLTPRCAFSKAKLGMPTTRSLFSPPSQKVASRGPLRGLRSWRSLSAIPRNPPDPPEGPAGGCPAGAVLSNLSLSPRWVIGLPLAEKIKKISWGAPPPPGALPPPSGGPPNEPSGGSAVGGVWKDARRVEIKTR